MNDALPVAVIGAGPIGLAAAAHLILRDEPVLVLEAASAIAANLREWAHVRLFSVFWLCSGKKIPADGKMSDFFRLTIM